MHSYLDLEGQEVYESYPEIRSHIFDFKQQKKPIPKELEDHPLYQLELSSTDRNGRKMNTRDMPSINAFPDFELNKESKMWLTQETPPTAEQISRIRQLIRTLLVRYGPKDISIPSSEAVKSIGPNLYSDGHVIKSDFEKPEFTWTSSWDLQRFKTDPRTEREVWLPPKGYKMVSSWWHFFTQPIVEKVPWLIGNETITDVRKDVSRRMKPCRKIDLKGFGLQFPHQYLDAIMEELEQLYPCEETREYRRSTKAMLSKMSIRIKEGEFLKPIRGVGLGYFSNLMSLVVAAVLQSCDIIKMFNDDILCPEEKFQEACNLLTSLGFILNEKKTGGRWIKCAYFAGVCMARAGSLRFYEAQGECAAIFCKRYHYERKAILLACSIPRRWLANYHYERIFGYEIRKGEAFDHPKMLGLDPTASYSTGYVKGGLLRRYQSPKPDEDEEMRRFWSISYPWKNPHDKKKFHEIRKSLKKKVHLVHYTEYEDYLSPEIEEVRGESLKPDFYLGNYQLPRWADLQSLIWNQSTSGRTTQGAHPKRAAYYMLQYLHSRNPINSWLTGGYRISTYFYREPGVDLFTSLLYESLRNAGRYSGPVVNKTQGPGALAVYVPGAGSDFLKKHGVIESSEEISVELENLHVEYERDAEDEVLDLDDLDEDYDVAYVSDEDDSSSQFSEEW
jgi:hypothetical protein